MAQATAPILDSTKYDLRPAPTNVRSWESNGLNADVAFGPFMTRRGHSEIFAGTSGVGGIRENSQSLVRRACSRAQGNNALRLSARGIHTHDRLSELALHVWLRNLR
jgi:hypothetical protein